MSGRKRVVITMEQGEVFDDIFQPDLMRELEREADVVLNDLGRPLTTEELAQRARDADAIITAWRTPRVDRSVTDAAPRLRMIAHAAGSVKNLYDPSLWDTGIVITNAASVMADYVGEFALLATLTMLRTLPKYAWGVSEGSWDGIRSDGWETLIGKTVGLIGLGNTARAFLRFLAPFECRVIAYDPYAGCERANELNVELVSLDEVLSVSKVISVHAPITDETTGMLGARELSLIPDGAVLVNTARGILIDHNALAKELGTGRFKAALDVTYPEPLPADHPLRKLPNVLLTPHVAGPTRDGRREMFRCVLDDLKLFWSGGTPKNVVTREMLATMA